MNERRTGQTMWMAVAFVLVAVAIYLTAVTFRVYPNQLRSDIDRLDERVTALEARDD